MVFRTFTILFSCRSFQIQSSSENLRKVFIWNCLLHQGSRPFWAFLRVFRICMALLLMSWPALSVSSLWNIVDSVVPSVTLKINLLGAGCAFVYTLLTVSRYIHSLSVVLVHLRTEGGPHCGDLFPSHLFVPTLFQGIDLRCKSKVLINTWVFLHLLKYFRKLFVATRFPYRRIVLLIFIE